MRPASSCCSDHRNRSSTALNAAITSLTLRAVGWPLARCNVSVTAAPSWTASPVTVVLTSCFCPGVAASAKAANASCWAVSVATNELYAWLSPLPARTRPNAAACSSPRLALAREKAPAARSSSASCGSSVTWLRTSRYAVRSSMTTP